MGGRRSRIEGDRRALEGGGGKQGESGLID